MQPVKIAQNLPCQVIIEIYLKKIKNIKFDINLGSLSESLEKKDAPKETPKEAPKETPQGKSKK